MRTVSCVKDGTIEQEIRNNYRKGVRSFNGNSTLVAPLWLLSWCSVVTLRQRLGSLVTVIAGRGRVMRRSDLLPLWWLHLGTSLRFDLHLTFLLLSLMPDPLQHNSPSSILVEILWKLPTTNTPARKMLCCAVLCIWDIPHLQYLTAVSILVEKFRTRS